MIDRPPHPTQGMPLPQGERRAEDETASFATWMAQMGSGPRLPVLPDGSPPSESAPPIPDQARIFNEDGFFAATPATPSSSYLTRDVPVLAPPVAEAGEVESLVPPGPSSGGIAPLSILAAKAIAAPSEAPGIVRLPVNPSRATAAPDAVQAAEPWNEPQVDSPIGPEVEGILDRAMGPPARMAGAQSALRIAIRDVERGLQILVAAHALGSEDRERLANEIAAFFSRHGLVPRDVRVAGRVHGDHSGKR